MRVALAGVLIVAIASGVIPAAAPAPARRASARALPPLHERIHRDSLRFSAGIDRASFDSLNASFIRDIADARRAGDSNALWRLLLFQGAGYAMMGDARRSLPVLGEALPLIEAAAETSAWLVALRWRAYAAGSLGQLDEQEAAARRLVELAERRDSGRFLAIGHNFLGWIARQRGDLRRARVHLERAVEGHRAMQNDGEEAFARIAYGATLTDLGDYGAARRSYARQIEIARRLKQGWIEAQAYNDLGVLERRIGDPGRAVEYMRRGYEGVRARGETAELVQAVSNLALAELELGRPESTREFVRQGLDICERRGYARLRGPLLVILANTEEQTGRPAAAEAAWRRAVAMGDSIAPDARSFAVLGLSRMLANQGRHAEALAAIGQVASELSPKLARGDAAWFHNGHADRLWGVGRHAEAIAMAERALAAEPGGAPSAPRTSAWNTIGACRTRLGRMAEAGVAYDSSCASWERLRGRPADPEWRASMWTQPGGVRLNAVEFLLRWPESAPESARVAAAYERLQRFRGRTLLEQAVRPGGPAPPAGPPAWTTARVQRELLAEGELLLEWAVGEDSALLFAISRTERRAFRLAAPRDLSAKIRVARDLMAVAPRARGDESAATGVARELAAVVFGGALPMVERARSLVLVPDGELHHVPFAALATRSGPLVDSRAIAVAPSVAMLGQSRSRPHLARRGLLAVPTGGAAGRLAGAEREAAWLATAFEGAELAEVGGREPEAFVASLAPHDLVHFAGHTEYDDRFPWRSGIDIGAPESKDIADEEPAPPLTRATRAGGRPLLRAETIAATPLAARLVVLSSCETAAGRVLAGEGLIGLSTAFLASGARTVVASLWPVDDRSTESLMREFYRVLAGGRNASAALRMAQNKLRQDRRTRHPFHWAGFVLVGDGATTVTLRPTPAWRRLGRGDRLGDLTPGAEPAGVTIPLAPGPAAGL